MLRRCGSRACSRVAGFAGRVGFSRARPRGRLDGRTARGAIAVCSATAAAPAELEAARRGLRRPGSGDRLRSPTIGRRRRRLAPSPPTSSRRNRTTVMLSRPPASLASSISALGGAVEIELAAARTSAICSSRDHRGQPVAAQQQHVAGAHRVGPGVDLDLGLGPERAGDDRALGVLGGLLVGQLAAPDQLLDQRVVLGEALERAVAEQVGAAVADVRDRERRRRPGTRRSAWCPSPRARARCCERS